jgi:RNA polymerase sigma factor (sigma-70 family)
VTDNTSAELQDMIDRLRRGDDAARRALLQRARDRLLRIAAALFEEDFPGPSGRHDLESVVREVWTRRADDLETNQPQAVDGFLGCVFGKVRQVLLDMAKHQPHHDADLHDRRGDSDPTQTWAHGGRAAAAIKPRNLAALTVFHQQVENLPDDQRRVFELRYYGGFSQAEIARMLELNPKQVSRRWLAATGRLALWLEEFSAPS